MPDWVSKRIHLEVRQLTDPSDLVCIGTLTVLPAHLTYGSRVTEGVAFLTRRIRATQAKIKARNLKREAEEAALAAAEILEREAVEEVEKVANIIA